MPSPQCPWAPPTVLRAAELGWYGSSRGFTFQLYLSIDRSIDHLFSSHSVDQFPSLAHRSTVPRRTWMVLIKANSEPRGRRVIDLSDPQFQFETSSLQLNPIVNRKSQVEGRSLIDSIDDRCVVSV